MKSSKFGLLFCILMGMWHVIDAMVLQEDKLQEIAVARARTLLDLGKMHLESKEYEQARKYFEEASEQDVDKVIQAKAWHHLAKIYYFGRGVTKSYVNARRYYEELANQDVHLKLKAQAWFILGEMWECLTCIEFGPNYEKAREYYEQVANQDVHLRLKAHACNLLALKYELGLNGLQKDYEKARGYYEQVAGQNSVPALKTHACKQLVTIKGMPKV